MKKTKKAMILTSALATTALCASLVAGGTYALFSSNDSVDITVRAGTVAVTADIAESTLSLSSMGEEMEGKVWENGGTAGFNDKKELELFEVMPGDSATFDIKIVNASTVNIKYRVNYIVTGELKDALDVTVTGTASTWTDWTLAEKKENDTKTVGVTVTLPEATGNEYQGKSAGVRFAVEAVQGNAAIKVVNSQDGLKAAIAAASVSGGTVQLASDVEMTETLNTVVTGKMELDLCGHTLKLAENSSISVLNGGSCTVKDGSLIASNKSDAKSIIEVNKDSTCNLYNVDLSSNCYCIFPWGDAALVNVVKSTITSTGAAAISTNANTVENYGVVINVEESKLCGNTGLLVNVPCKVNVKKCVIEAMFQGIFARGGDVTVIDSVISNVSNDPWAADYFNDKNWGTGNTANLAGLTVGNKGGAYQYPTKVKLMGSSVTSTGTYPTVYIHGNTTAGNGATILYDEASELGEVVVGGGLTKVSKIDLCIDSAKKMLAFAQEVNGGNNYAGKTVMLTADIDLADYDNWSPIGEYYTSTADSHAFSGTFDGNGYIVSNLKVNKENGVNLGLFGFIQNSAVIENVTVHNAQITGSTRLGALVGDAYQGKINNCRVTGKINIVGNWQVGGMIGYGYASYNDLSVDAEEGSVVKGVFVAENKEGDAIGGLIGYAPEVSGEYKNLSVKGLTVIGTRKIGGLIGHAGTYNRTLSGVAVTDTTVKIEAPDAYKTENATKLFAGGVIGEVTAGGGDNYTITVIGAVSNVSVIGVNSNLVGVVAGGTRSAKVTIVTSGVVVTDSTAEAL